MPCLWNSLPIKVSPPRFPTYREHCVKHKSTLQVCFSCNVHVEEHFIGRLSGERWEWHTYREASRCFLSISQKMGSIFKHNQRRHTVAVGNPRHGDTACDFTIVTDTLLAEKRCVTHNRSRNTHLTYRKEREISKFELVRQYTTETVRSRETNISRHSMLSLNHEFKF